MIFKYEFPFLGTVRVLLIAEYNEAALGDQDCDSRITAIYLVY